jgi:hypothetical protein
MKLDVIYNELAYYTYKELYDLIYNFHRKPHKRLIPEEEREANLWNEIEKLVLRNRDTLSTKNEKRLYKLVMALKNDITETFNKINNPQRPIDWGLVVAH